MEERTLIKALREHIGTEVAVCGWVEARRDHGKLIFLDIRDRSGSVQAVATPKAADAIDVAKELRTQFVIRAHGTVQERPENMRNADELNGDIEFALSSVEILSRAQELPFDMDGELNIDTYLDYLPLTLRTQRSRHIFTTQAILVQAFRDALQKQDFVEFQSPALTGGDAEGGASAFKIDYYYDTTAYLATSPQFYKQILVGAFERVFTTPKVFRGEKHATSRHLSEYSSLDFEMGFVQDHTDVMRVLETTMRAMVTAVNESAASVYEQFGVAEPLMPESIPTLKLTEAQAILDKEFNLQTAGEPDLEPDHERKLCEWARANYNSDFVFVTHYPVAKRPFYTYEDAADPGYTKSFDLLFRGLEITTGGQRIHDHDVLLEKLKEKGLDPELFSYYLQAFKFGMPPHGGSATGLERFTARLLNLSNVKEATLFPRDMTRIDTRLSEHHEE